MLLVLKKLVAIAQARQFFGISHHCVQARTLRTMVRDAKKLLRGTHMAGGGATLPFSVDLLFSPPDDKEAAKTALVLETVLPAIIT